MSNLARLSKSEKEEMELHKQVCLARQQCKGLNKHEIERHVSTLPATVQKRIFELADKKQLRKNAKRIERKV